ncbi:baseplate J/gp47 family protein [Pseudomonas sp. CCC3.2]|uniref:baseplate J/gp47 family protein n=1 Tax=unclassified Pseudomonas TaxID=196821 RepID=UPI002AB4CC3D|nr:MULTISPECIES: baseplate J/gp47 family protein [unclassified Pseudomonas]MDY7559976.1 baseplate J/gp47 family protein [Pseudomonas sp. AB6]MEB0179384.1 baseplate J/gp47 family protein [Pseudomonas sp. CCC3.2]MEB0210450.1 baseplate J/gp47 family protein [Pseudomonas sp. AB6]
MAALNVKDFTTLVRDQVSAVQGRAAGLVDFTIGSLLRAIVESNASVLQWLQQLIVTLLITTRAATSAGPDLDTWMADFGFLRQSASFAAGSVTFSRFTATTSALIPIGSIVGSVDGSQQFTVTIDTTNATYNATLGGYLVPAGTQSVTVPVIANTAGSAGNTLTGTVTTIVGSISGIDTVANALPFSGGVDPEADTAFRARFILWVQSLSKGTKSAIAYALGSMQQGVTYTLTENQDYSGNLLYGYFYAVVDDGSGAPSSAFLASAAAAIEAARPFTSRYGIFPPSLLSASVGMTIATDPSVTHSAVVALVVTALQTYIASLKLGQILPYTQLATIAYGVSPAVTNVSAVLLNGSTADIAATQKQVIRPGSIGVA